MVKCLECTTENQDGSIHCKECGRAFNGTILDLENELGADALKKSPFWESVDNRQQQVSTVAPIGNAVSVVSNPSAENEQKKVAATSINRIHATVVIERGASVGTQFSLTSEETFIGRWDADGGVFPDIDLDAHDPEAKVSRRHARILLKDNGYLIEDLGSTNGTYVNRGRRLLPGNRQILNDGDEIIVGKTFLRFHVER